MSTGPDFELPAEPPLGTELPAGTAFAGGGGGGPMGWIPGRAAPAAEDLDACVACGLCLPDCPTYRLTGEETMSPRGRIAAMRSVQDGLAVPDERFTQLMDECLVCRACEDVCPSHVPFGRLMEAARDQVEPGRPAGARAVRRLGYQTLLSRKKLLWAASALQPLARPFLPARVRAVTPMHSALFSRLPKVTPPPGGAEARGTVALLSGCVQDRWFREVNLASIRVLAAAGWRVTVPRGQGCCGALAAHNGRLAAADRLTRRNDRAFAGVDAVIVNAAGCGAHLAERGDDTSAPSARDLMAFLAAEGFPDGVGFGPIASKPVRVAYHDACHALRVLHVRDEPRALLACIPGLDVVEIDGGDRCCGGAGTYNITEPELSGQLRRQKAEAVAATGAMVVASANPGCTLQLIAGLREQGAALDVVHPVQLLDHALRAGMAGESAARA